MVTLHYHPPFCLSFVALEYILLEPLLTLRLPIYAASL